MVLYEGHEIEVHIHVDELEIIDSPTCEEWFFGINKNYKGNYSSSYVLVIEFYRNFYGLTSIQT